MSVKNTTVHETSRFRPTVKPKDSCPLNDGKDQPKEMGAQNDATREYGGTGPDLCVDQQMGLSKYEINTQLHEFAEEA